MLEARVIYHELSQSLMAREVFYDIIPPGFHPG